MYVPSVVNLTAEPSGASKRLNAGAGVLKILSDNGYAWDGTNNDSILNAYYEDGFICSENSDVKYKAIIIQDTTLPVAVMEKLEELAQEGTQVIFYGDLPDRQPGYAGGKYEEEDEKVRNIAENIVANIHCGLVKSETELMNNLSGAKGAIYYEKNENVRFARRTLETGGEVAFIRNNINAATTVEVNVAPGKFANYYWLEQSTGEIYRADVQNNRVAFTLAKVASIILLCEPANYAIDNEDVSAGLPLNLEIVDIMGEEAIVSIDQFDLTVTADNIGTATKAAEATTKIYQSIELGYWNSTTYLDGELRYVNAPGTYTAKFNISPEAGKRYCLSLGSVYNVAKVKINNEEMDALAFSPYSLDITEQLICGENDLEIKVTPSTFIRFVGFSQAFSDSGNTDIMYTYYIHTLIWILRMRDWSDRLTFFLMWRPPPRTKNPPYRRLPTKWKALTGPITLLKVRRLCKPLSTQPETC